MNCLFYPHDSNRLASAAVLRRFNMCNVTIYRLSVSFNSRLLRIVNYLGEGQQRCELCFVLPCNPIVAGAWPTFEQLRRRADDVRDRYQFFPMPVNPRVRWAGELTPPMPNPRLIAVVRNSISRNCNLPPVVKRYARLK
jgi:hypothetical protein